MAWQFVKFILEVKELSSKSLSFFLTTRWECIGVQETMRIQVDKFYFVH